MLLWSRGGCFFFFPFSFFYFFKHKVNLCDEWASLNFSNRKPELEGMRAAVGTPQGWGTQGCKHSARRDAKRA